MSVFKPRRAACIAIAAASLAIHSGCHHGFQRRAALQDSEIASADGFDSGQIVTGPRVSFVDRHPLLSKPVEWYERGGPNPILGTLAGAVVGVPAGVLGEVRQIIVGCPVKP